MHAKWSQCCSSSKKKREFKGVSCAFSLNSAARRSHSAASCLSSNDMGTSTTRFDTGQNIRLQIVSSTACGYLCGTMRVDSPYVQLRHIFQFRVSVQLPPSFSTYRNGCAS